VEGGSPRSPSATSPRRLEDEVERARLGDVEAFNAIVEHTAVELHALALRLTGNEHDACDVVQEAYLRAFRSIARFRGDASVTTWLYRIVANCSANHHRARRRRRETSLSARIADAVPSPDVLEAGSDGLVLRVDERTRLLAAIDRLSPTLRAPVVLHDVYGFGHAEIGASLGISKSASKVRLHRARRQLKESLADKPLRKSPEKKPRTARHRPIGVEDALAG
jgi:RNA polymerase sigma-70 factor, ECF subfamily